MINQIKNSAQASSTTESIPTHFLRRAWMEKTGLTNVELAERLDLTPSRISTIMRKGRCPRKYIRVLREEYQMPESLLPDPSREKTGPKPKHKSLRR